MEHADFLKRSSPTSLRVMSYNVGRDSIFPDAPNARPEKFGRLMRAVQPDIVALQEIFLHDQPAMQQLVDRLAPLPGDQPWNVYRGSAMAILSRFPLRFTTDQAAHDTHRNPALAVIDLPDDRFPFDLCLISNHFKCCGGTRNDPMRQAQADATLAFLRDGQTPGGLFDFTGPTAIVLAGDLNLVGGPQPRDSMLTGNIVDEGSWGTDIKPDPDGTDLAAAHPKHNTIGPDYTWRDDSDNWPPGRLDYVLYSDSLLAERSAFVLNSSTLSPEALAEAGLEKWDSAADEASGRFDHLPLVVDFEPTPIPPK